MTQQALNTPASWKSLLRKYLAFGNIVDQYAAADASTEPDIKAFIMDSHTEKTSQTTPPPQSGADAEADSLLNILALVRQIRPLIEAWGAKSLPATLPEIFSLYEQGIIIAIGQNLFDCAGKLLNDAGMLAILACQLRDGLKYYEQADHYWEKAERQQHAHYPDQRTQALRGKARAQSGLNSDPTALPLLRRALDLHRNQTQLPRYERMRIETEIRHNIGNCLHRMGRFPEALNCYKDALGILRAIEPNEHLPGALEPLLMAQYQYDVGQTYRDLKEPHASVGYLRGALELYRRHTNTGNDNFSNHADCYIKLAQSLREIGNECFPNQDRKDRQLYNESLSLYHEGLDYLKACPLVDQLSRSYYTAIIESGIGEQMRDLRDTAAGCEHYLMAWTACKTFLQAGGLPAALKNTTFIRNAIVALRDANRHEDAEVLATDVIREFESKPFDPFESIQERKTILPAYGVLLEKWVRERNDEKVFLFLAALRERAINAIHNFPNDQLASASKALSAVSLQVSQTLHLIIIEELHDEATLIAVLTAEGSKTTFQYDISRDLGRMARDLWGIVHYKYGANRELNDDNPSDTMQHLHFQAFLTVTALPQFLVTIILFPEPNTELLISGNTKFTGIPWEIIPISQQPEDYLGLHYILPRITPITAPHLARLGEYTIGNENKLFAILAASHTGKTPLEGVVREGGSVSKRLRAVGMNALHGVPFIRDRATKVKLCEICKKNVTILHFCGHSFLEAGKELLILHPFPQGQKTPDNFFGREDLLKLQTETNGALLFPQRPMIVLNSCVAGLTHSEDGERNDLVFEMLRQGAACVIATAYPVKDDIGEEFAKRLYEGPVRGRSCGKQFFEARKQIAQKLLAGGPIGQRYAWGLLAFHGNPFCLIP